MIYIVAPSASLPALRACPGLARCYEAGLARAVGTSNYGPEQLAKVNAYWRDRGVPHTVNQVQFSLLSTLPLETGRFTSATEQR